MIKIYYELKDNYVSKWARTPMFANEHTIVEENARAERTAIKHFNDNYFDYKQTAKGLVYDETHNGIVAIETARANARRITEIQPRLDALSQDIIQDAVGEVVPNIAERKAEFIALHNELRVLKGLAPREVN